MTKHKSRADRKSKRQRASHAKEHGLPAAPAEPMDARRSIPTKRSVSLRARPRQRSAWLSILVGVLLALGVVFVIAQNRKASMMIAPVEPAPGPSQAPSSP